MYTFCINVHDRSYIYCSTNQTLGKPGWRTNYATQAGNWHKTFSIKLTCFILSTCFTKVNFTYLHKGVKHASSITIFSVVSLLEFHNIIKGTSSMYLVHGKYFLHMTLYLTKKFLVCLHTRHIRIQRHWRRNQQSYTLRTLHHLMNKLAVL